MAIKILKLPIYNETYYSYSVALEGETFTLEFLFLQTRSNSWFVTLKNSSQEILVTGQRLTPNTVLFQGYQLEGLSGFFYFESKDLRNEDFRVGTPKDFYTLYYIYDTGV
jgi:hypothetical protein